MAAKLDKTNQILDSFGLKANYDDYKRYRALFRGVNPTAMRLAWYVYVANESSYGDFNWFTPFEKFCDLVENTQEIHS